MPYGLGVDLGTTFTAAAVAGSSGTGMVALGPDFVVPSVVHVAGDGTVTSGLAAEVAGAREPLRLCYWHKRRLGDPTPLVIGGAPYPPAALLAAQLRDVLAVAARERSASPDSVVLTCPAVWGPYRRELFDEVPRLAGLTGVTVVTEPEAAAMHYSVERRLGPGETVAVYDLGGGTFDATILRVNRGGMEILGTPEGVEQLGGIDFDDALLSHLDTRLDGAVGALDPEDSEQAGLLAQVRAACVRAKEDLSTEPEVRVRVTLPAGRREVLVTRQEFEDMIRPSLALTIEALRRTVASAGLRPADLSAVLLAGGSSRIPLIPRLLSDALGRPVRVSLHPKHIVALGAAAAAQRSLPAGRRAGSAARVVTVAGAGAPVQAGAPAEEAVEPALVAAPLPTAPEAGDADETEAAAPAPAPAAPAVPAPPAGNGPRHAAGSRPRSGSRPESGPPSAGGPPDTRPRGVPRWLLLGAAAVVLAVVAVLIVAVLPRHGAADAGDGGGPATTGPVAGSTGGPTPSTSDGPGTGVPGLNNVVIFDGTVGVPYQAYISSEAGSWAGIMLGPYLSGSDQVVSAAAELGGTGTTWLRVRWTGATPGQLYFQSSVGRDMSAYADADAAVVFDVMVHAAPTGPVTVAVHCQYPCAGEVPVGDLLRSLPLDTPSTVRIPLSCFVDRGLDLAKVDTAFLVGTGGSLDASFSGIRWVVGGANAAGALSCGSLA